MIRKLLQYLFGWPCNHEWETLKEAYPIKEIDRMDNSIIMQGTAWLYRCKKCCKSKQVRSIK